MGSGSGFRGGAKGGNVPADLQDKIDQLDDLLGNSGQTATGVQTSLDQEIADRQSGDISLDTYIDEVSIIAAAAEAETQFNSDAIESIDESLPGRFASIGDGLNSLDTRLSIEESNTIESDTSLDTYIDEVSLLLHQRTGAGGALEQYIDDEISNARVELDSIDSSLQTRLSIEEVSSASADTSLEVRLSNEEVKREEDDTSLETRLSNEESTRESKDDSLEQLIGDVSTGLSSDLATEIADRISGDQSVYTAAESYIDHEISEALAQTGDLADDLSLIEDIINTGNIGPILEKVADVSDAESLAEQSIVSLETRLSNEESTSASLDDSLETRISTEESASLSGDTSLDARITAEIATLATEVYVDQQDNSLIAIYDSHVTSLEAEVGSLNGANTTYVDQQDSSLDTKIGDLDSDLRAAISAVDNAPEQIVNDISAALSAEIQTTNTEITSIDTLLGNVPSTNYIDTKATSLETRISDKVSVETSVRSSQVTSMNTRFTSVDTRLTSADTRLTSVDTRFDVEIDAINENIDNLIAQEASERNDEDLELKIAIESLETYVNSLHGGGN